MCEQLFSWLAKYKHIVRHMNEARFLFFICRMCHVHNMELEAKMASKGKLQQAGSTADLTLEPTQELKADLPGSELYWKALVSTSILNAASSTLQPSPLFGADHRACTPTGYTRT